MTRTRLAKAPYDQYGSLISYVASYPDRVHEWRANKPFPAMLVLDGTTRGMSAARFTWHSDRGRTFEMFMTDAADLMRGEAPIYLGTVDTWWIAQKRGKNYGIRRATQDDLKYAGHTGGPKADCKACEGTAYGYESWCPVRPTADEQHQFRFDPIRTSRCLCGEAVGHHVHHDGYSATCPCVTCRARLDACTCSKSDNAACSSANCQG